MATKLVKIIKVSGVMKTLSGVRINNAGTDIGPGGLDAEVIKNPMTGKPYIPGSSVKGKMRSLLELHYGKYNQKGDPCGCGKPECIVCTLFGAYKNVNATSGIPRLIVRDMDLTEEYANNKDILETKASTMINRVSSTASGGSLRFVERVAAGVEFNYEINIRVFDTDDEKKLMQGLEEAMKMLENDGIGGGVTTGSGKIKFITKEITEINY